MFLGTKGRNKGEFTNLQGVAASTLGKVLIADSNNQCVQVKITTSCCSQSADRAAWRNHWWRTITYHCSVTLLVTNTEHQIDAFQNHVFYFNIFNMFCVMQIFSNDGQFRSRFGIRGRTPGQLQRPTGVAIHPNGDIIIADYDNKWVSIFSSEGKFKVSQDLMSHLYLIL